MDKKNKSDDAAEKVSLQVAVSPVADGGWGWLVCVAGFIAQFIVLGIQNNSGILYTALLDEYKTGKGETGMLIGNFS